MITKRQKDLLAIIYDYIKTTGYPPTIEEMRETLGVVSNQSVLDLLKHLEKKGLIKRQEGAARSIALLPLVYRTLGKPPLVPFLGISHAGAPIEPIEIDGEWQSLSSDASILKSNVYLIKIQGSSMINAGIDDGDMVVVKEEKEFISGDIVLAEVNGETTVKRFISDDQPPFIYLKPENPDCHIIPVDEKSRLKGKVISIIKRKAGG